LGIVVDFQLGAPFQMLTSSWQQFDVQLETDDVHLELNGICLETRLSGLGCNALDLKARRLDVIAVGRPVVPDRPRTDPGVPFSSTGLFRNTRFRISSNDRDRAIPSWPPDDPGPWYLEMVERIREALPAQAGALASSP
jgi:hypothetical protein